MNDTSLFFTEIDLKSGLVSCCQWFSDCDSKWHAVWSLVAVKTPGRCRPYQL